MRRGEHTPRTELIHAVVSFIWFADSYAVELNWGMTGVCWHRIRPLTHLFVTLA